MKSFVILVLALAVGFDLAVANTVLKQSVGDKDLLSGNNDSSTNHEETLSNNSEMEQKNIDRITEDRTIEATLEIELDQDIPNPTEEFQESIDNQIGLQDNQFNLQEDIDANHENEFELVKQGDYYYNDVVYKDPSEIMDTAAGFVPIPIFRKKQKQMPRRKYSNRRYNRRPYASRRQFYFYPYYRYSYYRPSSLRYFYY